MGSGRCRDTLYPMDDNREGTPDSDWERWDKRTQPPSSIKIYIYIYIQMKDNKNKRKILRTPQHTQACGWLGVISWWVASTRLALSPSHTGTAHSNRWTRRELGYYREDTTTIDNTACPMESGMLSGELCVCLPVCERWPGRCVDWLVRMYC